MGQIVKRKKKGRPSKADLARRAVESAAEQDVRRSHRRRNVRYNIDYYDYLDEDDEDEEEDQRRREKKLKLVVKLNQGSEPLAPPSQVHTGAREIDAKDYSSDDECERKPLKKRSIGNGRDDDADEQDEDDDHGDGGDGDEDDGEERGRKVDLKGLDSPAGTPSDLPSGVPLPDKRTLELILDKLQKKDTYGVYAEPVDSEELPDYHDVIEHPMDFATVRKKLTDGSYSALEQFECDIFLICSNAMQYNAQDTIYYRQARSIQELARKKFERLRIEFGPSEKESKSEQKTRSNSLIKKSGKKPFCLTSQEPIGSDFSTGATLATIAEGQNGSNMNQGGGFERPSNTDVVEGNPSLIDTNFEKAEDLSSGKGLLSNLGRKHIVYDDNRRTTYSIFNQSAVRSDSIFTTFEGELKQLVPVGLHAEFSYARSMAHFAATLGPVAWKVASQRIEQSLPAGCKYGRGWVGEYEPLQTPVLMLENCSQKEPGLIPKLQSNAELRKNDKTKSYVSAKELSVSGLISDRKQSSFYPASAHTSAGKLSFSSSAGTKPSTPDNAIYQKQNPQSRDFTKTQNAVSKQFELNSLPSAHQTNAQLITEKQFSSNSEMADTRSKESVSRNINLLPSVPVKQPETDGVVTGVLSNGKISNGSFNSRMSRLSPVKSPKNVPRGTSFTRGLEEQGFSDPAQTMRILAERANKQQKSSNQSPVETPESVPPVPSVRRDDSSNAAAATARAWMSIGAGGFKQATDYSLPKTPLSADPSYNPTREFCQQISQTRGQIPLSRGMQSQSERSSFPMAFVPQPARMANETQLRNRPLAFPQSAPTDLSSFQLQYPWRGGLSPHTQPRPEHETIPPDLNIGFQSPGSPARPSTGVLVDSQQPDLALQL